MNLYGFTLWLDERSILIMSKWAPQSLFFNYAFRCFVGEILLQGASHAAITQIFVTFYIHVLLCFILFKAFYFQSDYILINFYFSQLLFMFCSDFNLFFPSAF